MCWLIGFLVGIAYAFVMFSLGTKFDNDAYYKGITLTTMQCIVVVLVIAVWPITIFIPKLRSPEFYANIKFRKKNDTRL